MRNKRKLSIPTKAVTQNHFQFSRNRKEKFTHQGLNTNCIFCRVPKQYMYEILIVPQVKETI